LYYLKIYTDEVAEDHRRHWDDGKWSRYWGSIGTALENAALQSGKTYLEKEGWDAGKHVYQ